MKEIIVLAKARTNMITLKSQQQIAQLRKAGRIVAETYEIIRPHLVAGVTTAEIDKIAEKYIRSRGDLPSYIGYGAIPAQQGRPAISPFSATICNSLNDIGAAIQQYCEAQGYSTVREYTGHGVGRSLHEEPYVFHLAQKGPSIKLRPGM